MVTFGLGVEPVRSVVGSVGLQFIWLDEDDGSFSWDGTMIRLHNTAKWHDGTMRWYDEMARQYDGTICHNGRWYNGTMYDGTIAQCYSFIINVLK